MKLKSILKSALLAFAAVAVTGCVSSRSMSYLIDMDYGVPTYAPPAPELKFQPNDKLAIEVFSKAAELTEPFNLTSRSGSTGSVTYEVDANGDIDFPVLGKIHVEGLTIKEVKAKMEKMISEMGYIREPVVMVKLNNFTITVIGASRNQVLTVESDAINLFQVIAQAGGIDQNAKIRDVMVVRTANGQRTSYKVNMQSKNVFNSPVYYLQQNDIVYVKVKGGRMTAGGQTVLSAINMGMSFATLATTIFFWLTRTVAAK